MGTQGQDLSFTNKREVPTALEARVEALERELAELRELLRRGLLQVVRGVERIDSQGTR